MFVHTVFFWLKEKENEQARQQLHAGLKELATIDEIQTAYVGAPADTRRPVIDHTFDFSITFVFSDDASQERYQVHPEHLAFIDACKHLWERVQVYDAVS
ncbi:Dabb family protein [Arundinibacter roseus]|uniref:Dabb family protein n=1 Tax=Arundinibacter roseus TaxID=2070510 RepID=A0A4R4KKS7_9BACT|nr:Dabb family protein [Arundinibacter roseus]TDB68884.1 Dabb family protein [Arundinibacter roseus]